MGRSSAARNAVRQRLRSVNRGLQGCLDSDAEGLHRARVATRRLREALAVCASPDAPEPVADLRRAIRDTTRTLGGVRELDVALTLVDQLTGERPDLRPALARVRAAMMRQRGERLERMRRDIAASRLQRVSRAFAHYLDRAVDDSRPRDLLADRLQKRIEELRQAADQAALLYAPDRLHRIRLATKKLRYGLELAAEMRAASTARLVAQLKRLQDHLGQMHDLEVVTQFAREALGQPDVDAAALAHAAPALALLDGRIHALHADYVADRGTVTAMLDRATQICERLRRQ